MKIALKNCQLIQPLQKLNKKSNLLLEDGIITKIGTLTAEDLKHAEVYDLKDNFVAPGFFDMHVHLREPGREDEETVQTGCDAAAQGGFTGIACMPNTEPALDSAEVISLIQEKAKNHLVEVFPVGAATVNRKGEVISPMAELVNAGAVGFSDDGVAIKTARILKTALEYANMFDVPVIEHCEDESLAGGAMNEGATSTFLGLPPIPAVAEDLIVMRDILMAEYTGGKIHIAHISTKNAVQMVREAKAKGIRVTAEVAPHHFTLTEEAVKGYNSNTKMNPPLRSHEDVNALLEGLKDGTIDCIASDHAPHSLEEKEMEFEFAPNGIVGLETEIGLALTELYHKKILTIEQIVEKFAINPRKILNLPIPKFEVGAEANFTIFDINEIWSVDISQFKSKSKNSPFNKRLLKGKAMGVINKKKLFLNGKLKEI
ncbi:MAG: dihydroorotase [Ignavibacteriaceae bacterium]